MKMKVIIRATMKDNKARSKALKRVATVAGVMSVALGSVDKNQIEVVGDGLDAVQLVSLLRKYVGHAELVSVYPFNKEKKEQKVKKEQEVKKEQPMPLFKSIIYEQKEDKRSLMSWMKSLFVLSRNKSNQHDDLLGMSAFGDEKEEKKDEKRPEQIPNYPFKFTDVLLVPPDNSEASVDYELFTPSESEASFDIREKQVNQPGDTSSDNSSPCIFKLPEIEDEIIPSKSEASHDTREKQVDQPGDTYSNSWPPCIFRLPDLLGFKEPELVSLGPYHRNKNLPLEKCKYSFLEKFLSRTKSQGKELCFYVRQMMTLEWLARRCYSRDLPMPSSEFVEMMLVDSCFIMEVLYHFGGSEGESRNEVFPLEPWQMPIVVRDLLLLENQIPFFVLEKLFDLSKSEEGTATVSVSSMALKVYNLAFPGSMDFGCKFDHLEDVPKHLLDLLLKTIRPSNPSTDSTSLFLKTIPLEAMVLLYSVFLWLFKNHRRNYQMRWSKKEDDMPLKSPGTSSRQKEYKPSIQSEPSTSKTAKLKRVENAEKLRRSGIEFRPRRADSFTDIHFKDGVLEIPPIAINDLFITVLVNCMAFEQRSTGCSNDITAYVSFLSGLIRYPSDVECLCSDGIISRFSDENERVASSFNYLQSMVSDLDILGDSYLYKTIMETEGYYTGNRVMTWLRYFWRDPRMLLFCITSLWFAFVLI